jgi:hypothetical protein
MAAVTATIAAIGVAAAVAGTVSTISAQKKQSELQQQQAANNFDVSQLQIQGANITNAAAQKTAAVQTAILDVQRRQAELQADTSKSVIQKQLELEDLKQQGNALSKQYNDIARGATVNLEGLNQQNDLLNRSSDAVSAQQENLQRTIASLNDKRAQRDAIRQGITAGSTALARGVNSGGGTDSSATAGNRANIASQVHLAQLQASQGDQGTQTAINFAQQQRELAVGSRELGVQARGVNYGLRLGQFDLADNMYALSDKQFEVNKNISNIYLGAQDTNAALVGQANDLNKDLVTNNVLAQNELLGIQNQIYAKGGQNNLISAQAAQAGGIANLGMGMTSLGNSFVNNAQTIGKITDNWTTPTYSDVLPGGAPLGQGGIGSA